MSIGAFYFCAEFPALTIDHYTITVIDRAINSFDIPSGLVVYDSYPEQNTTALKLRLHKKGELTVPTLVSPDELPLAANGVYIIDNWDSIAPKPFGSWLRVLVNQYNARADAHNWWNKRPHRKQRNKQSQPHYIKQVILPVFEQLAGLLPIDSPGLFIPEPEKCKLRHGMYKIYIGTTFMGGIVPSFDRDVPLFFVAANQKGEIVQYPIKTMEQLIGLVCQQCRIRKIRVITNKEDD